MPQASVGMSQYRPDPIDSEALDRCRAGRGKAESYCVEF